MFPEISAIDPGLTVFKKDGTAIPSQHAIGLISPQPQSQDVSQLPVSSLDPNKLAPDLGTGQGLKYTPTDQYRNIINKPLNIQDYPEPTGAGKFFNRLAGALTGFSQGVKGKEVEPTFYNLQHAPYLRAQAERAGRLKELEPAVNVEEQEKVQSRLAEQSEASLAATRAYRESQTANTIETNRIRQEESERRKAEDTARDEQRKQDLIERGREADARVLISAGKVPLDREASDLLAKQIKGTLTEDEAIKLKAYNILKVENPIKIAEARGKAFGEYRPITVEDPNNPNRLVPQFAGQAIRSGATAPGSIDFQHARALALADVPTSTMRTMAQRSEAILPYMETASSDVDKLASKLGPFSGRFYDALVNKLGADDPEFAGLDQKLHFIASGLALAHSLKTEYALRLEKDFHEAQSPADLKARLAAADKLILGYTGAVPKYKSTQVQHPDTSGFKINHRRPAQ